MILLAHGPNLSQLGTRDPDQYGTSTEEDLLSSVRAVCGEAELFGAEAEGELVARLHEARTDGTRAVIINPGALTHYSYSLRDALELLTVPVIEVHLSQTAAREPFRRHSVVSPVVDVTITGAGAFGYRLAAQTVAHLLESR